MKHIRIQKALNQRGIQVGIHSLEGFNEQKAVTLHNYNTVASNIF